MCKEKNVIETALEIVHQAKMDDIQGNDIYEYLNDLDILLSKEAIKIGLVGKMSKSDEISQEPIRYKMVWTINCQHEDTQCCDCVANKKEIDCPTFIADRVEEGLPSCHDTSDCYQVFPYV